MFGIRQKTQCNSRNYEIKEQRTIKHKYGTQQINCLAIYLHSIRMCSSGLSTSKRGLLIHLKNVQQYAKMRSKVYNSSHETSHREYDKILLNLEWQGEERLGLAVNYPFSIKTNEDRCRYKIRKMSYIFNAD